MSPRKTRYGENKMAGFYKIYKMKDLIRKTENGEINIERSIDAIRELAIASEHHKDSNILIDLRVTETALNFGDLLTLALEFAYYKDCFRNKIAAIIPDDPERIKRAKFFKADLTIKGFLFDYFTDFEKAVEWLSEICPEE
jgi:hypothetical protein